MILGAKVWMWGARIGAWDERSESPRAEQS